jgi:putative Holliday junction resolvase
LIFSQSPRILAVDYGLAKVGLAHSDGLAMLATPLPYLALKEKLKKINPHTVAKLLIQTIHTLSFPIETIILGNPIHLDGASSPLSQQVALLQAELQKEGLYKVILFDERLSTAQTQKTLMEAGLNRRQRSQVIDSATAALILQTYLDIHIPKS